MTTAWTLCRAAFDNARREHFWDLSIYDTYDYLENYAKNEMGLNVCRSIVVRVTQKYLCARLDNSWGAIDAYGRLEEALSKIAI